MKQINLSMKKESIISLEFDNILPELLFDKTVQEIEETIIYRGNRKEKLSDYFDVEIEQTGSGDDVCKINIKGNTSRIKRVGYMMSSGTIEVYGDVDFHVGSKMSGGHIIVHGNAESYAGREMTGGLLEIKGNVKEFCASSYAGEWRGMSGGKIIVEGNVGKQLAEYMIGGEILVHGDCDILAGVHMAGGTITIDGNIQQWYGGQMKKGTIILNKKTDEILPGFTLQETVHHPKINNKYHVGVYKLYAGDEGVKGKGQIWIRQ